MLKKVKTKPLPKQLPNCLIVIVTNRLPIIVPSIIKADISRN